jgi:serine/threonine protein kinase
MPTQPEPSGRSSSARRAAAEPPNDAGAAPLPPAAGSTGSHTPEPPLSDIIRAGKGSSRTPSPESDIAQFLANPAPNTDEQPTVITKAQSGVAPNPNTPPPVVVPVSSPPPSIAGRRLGHFELIEAVGSGGMAAVLKARDTELGRVVALKILPPEAARDPDSVARFKAEARAAAKLDHDNIARVYFCGEDQGLHFIAFEFVEGINLQQMIDRRGQLPAGECVRYMIQVAAGLNHAAKRGVVHRDIKPSNILVTPDGRAKIVDMGLARHLGADVNGGVTQSGVTLGTFDYISPEQALDPRRADVRSDIYSLGCAFYHALTGRPPVPEGTAARKLRAHQTEAPLDPRMLNPAIPDELAAVLARMMAKDPQQRYQTPNELIAHLKALAERFDVGGSLPQDALTVPTDPRVLPEPPRVRAWWVVAAATVALAAVAFVSATSDPGPAPRLPARPAATAKPFEQTDAARPAPPVPAVEVVRTVAELVRKLEDPTTEKVALAGETFDLTKLDRAVTVAAPKIELVGAPNGRTRVLVSAGPDAAPPGALVFKAPEALAVRRVWFEFKLDPDVSFELQGPTQVVGLRATDARTVSFADCLFTSADVRLRDHDARAVSVTRAPDGPAPRVELDRCLFGRGTVAVSVPPGASVRATDSGFGPHVACVQIDAPANPPDAPETEVAFDRCSLMLDPRCAAVDVPKGTKARVRAGDCAFAPVGASVAPAVVPRSTANRRGVVVRTRDAAPAGVKFAPTAGRTSAFYEVDPIATELETLTFEQCRTAALGVDGTGHTELKQRPWENRDPLAVLATADPWPAFALRIALDAQVFTRAGNRWVPLGAWFTEPDGSGLHRAYPKLYESIWPPPRPLSAEEQARKVWFPSAPESALRPGVYKELSALLKAAKSDDVILIRHTGELKVDNAEIRSATKPSEGELRLTFRPEEGSLPVLVSEADDDRDQTLFKLKSGEVAFENLHFVLRANRPKDGQLVAAVAVIGGKACRFVGCTFTLAEEDESKVAVVHLPDIDKVMAMDSGTRPVPKVTFEKCVLRGRGRGIWSEVSRPASASFADSLTALDGPVLLSEGGGKPGAVGTGGEAKFARVTVLAAGPLVELRGKPGDPKGGNPVRYKVETDECLFVQVAGAGKPLAEVEGADPMDLKAVLDWQVKKPNRYANFDATAALALVRPGGELPAKELARDDWFAHAGEPPGADKRFGTVTLVAPPAALADLLKLKPADAAVKSADFPDAAEPKALEAGTDPKALPLPPE